MQPCHGQASKTMRGPGLEVTRLQVKAQLRYLSDMNFEEGNE
jgi:hypothetical protein